MKWVEDSLRWIRRVGGNTDLSDKGLIFLAAGCQGTCLGRFALQSATTARKGQFHVREKQQNVHNHWPEQ